VCASGASELAHYEQQLLTKQQRILQQFEEVRHNAHEQYVH